MYYGATSETLEKAKVLRKSETNAEKLLWKELRSRKFKGLKFRRQHPVSQFIVDFYCHELRLVIEVDGKIHEKLESREYDENREAELVKYEIGVIRFTNSEIENNMTSVLDKLNYKIVPLSGGNRGS